MKTLLSIITLFTSMSFASEIKVTSFRFLDSRSPAAEICGELISPTGKPEFLKITVDPETHGPANYFVWAGKEGKFCSLVATFRGNAKVEIQN